jgi:hypothetical protein
MYWVGRIQIYYAYNETKNEQNGVYFWFDYIRSSRICCNRYSFLY